MASASSTGGQSPLSSLRASALAMASDVVPSMGMIVALSFSNAPYHSRYLRTSGGATTASGGTRSSGPSPSRRCSSRLRSVSRRCSPAWWSACTWLIQTIAMFASTSSMPSLPRARVSCTTVPSPQSSSRPPAPSSRGLTSSALTLRYLEGIAEPVPRKSTSAPPTLAPTRSDPTIAPSAAPEAPFAATLSAGPTSSFAPLVPAMASSSKASARRASRSGMAGTPLESKPREAAGRSVNFSMVLPCATTVGSPALARRAATPFSTLCVSTKNSGTAAASRVAIAAEKP
mmetsp:Transcript_3711/g.14995  ORF Transcript_3711/g.14995 Transcript_3711/m.14995 type:complete len:288 (+) Transcript_3711:642-1505(+)